METLWYTVKKAMNERVEVIFAPQRENVIGWKRFCGNPFWSSLGSRILEVAVGDAVLAPRKGENEVPAFYAGIKGGTAEKFRPLQVL